MASTDRPACIVNWTEIEGPDEARYKNDDELLGIGAAIGRHLGLKKLGIHHKRLPPGRRTSFPHAESAEEEFVYVLSGTPDVWLDGHLHRLKAGDAVGFPSGTGLSHSFLNNTEEEVCSPGRRRDRQGGEPDLLPGQSGSEAAPPGLVA